MGGDRPILVGQLILASPSPLKGSGQVMWPI